METTRNLSQLFHDKIPLDVMTLKIKFILLLLKLYLKSQQNFDDIQNFNFVFTLTFFPTLNPLLN